MRITTLNPTKPRSFCDECYAENDKEIPADFQIILERGDLNVHLCTTHKAELTNLLVKA